ncbi:carboxypeptidase-like regulatory domain-containing protein [Actinomadura sp. DC4]|uniref:carboxypeptidase-like regulatory domain-containing protein n=1 Tax=Actinomadura sp. DC4 TaxID=3055069 RepID=UPI0025B0637F|nr:carboxypeptidase-like regulatory domain-containing protein [Actinomadura sp. DC4]MDN3359366.1 hypothetical protein [Actinomadura sp. DC4]
MNDEELAEALREVFPPVPEHARALGRAAFAWFEPAAALATLTSETVAVPSGVRGGGTRLLTFSGARISVEVEVCGREIVGQLAPPSAAEVVLRSPGGERGTRTDEAGSFALSGVPPGVVSLLFRLADATSVVTSWIRV